MSPVFRHRIRVRYSECDAQGIVFNANHLTYFDVGLTELWRDAFGSYQSMVDAGADVVVASASVDFHGSPRFDDEIELVMAVERLGTTSMTTRYEERRDGEVLVTGRTVHVFVDPATLQKIEIPPHVRERLEAYTT